MKVSFSIRKILFGLSLLVCTLANAQTYQSNIPVHDPVMIKQDSLFYLFCTGRGISSWSSSDMINWKREKPVFDTLPWAVQAVKGFANHIWAPDISFHNGLYYLYYSISAFGKNTSCIGVATNKTLHTSSPDYKWTDHGKVIQSYPGKTNWNAIDPNIITDKKGNAWMVFGSFWDGIKLAKLTKSRLEIKGDTINLLTIASRKKKSSLNNPPPVDDNPKDAGGNAIEAPFLFYKNGYYYLFASIDYCCKGVKSTYKMIVGKSKKITGPFLDKEGTDMAKGGGTILLPGDNNWYGVGHNAVANFDRTDYLIFHGYDASDNGKSKLLIKKITWVDGWPVVQQNN
jgi:arabinan endo-1,5-alpha-L-arabinosidase